MFPKDKTYKHRRSNICTCIKVYQNSAPVITYVHTYYQEKRTLHSCNFAFQVLVKCVFCTRGVYICSRYKIFLFLFLFTLSADRRRRRRLSWLGHCRNDCDDTAEIVAAICIVLRRNTVVHRLLRRRLVLADRRLQSYLNQIDWNFSRQRLLLLVISFDVQIHAFASTFFLSFLYQWMNNTEAKQSYLIIS